MDDFFERGYLKSFVQAKAQTDLILDNISDGIIAHDIKRRIFYFNASAERITGYSRGEVLGADCHDVFPGKFCGGKCMFCDPVAPDIDVKRQELEISTRSGERRVIDMTVRGMKNPEGQLAGVLVSFRDLTRERELAKRVGETYQFSGIIGRDKKMLEVFELINDLAETTVPVLVQGESGTGKELVAAAIHNEGPRADKHFVPVNCGALPETLLESELFGYVKGAFTGAMRDKKGRFELADGGTIFLDEIGDISPAMQVRLMRVLQEGTFERVGSEKTIKVDVRLISATNKDLTKEIAAGRFREDLFYRLSVVPIRLPPLRERRNDIPLLVQHVLKRALEMTGKKDIGVSDEALDVMLMHDWPGNVRELQNWIQFALVKCKTSMIRPEHLPPHAVASRPSEEAANPNRRKKLDAESLRLALNQANGNKVEAAKILGVSRATLYRFMEAAGGPVGER
ncbi:MAG: sigma-54-dependent Fis family transcriptional regulator [Verrucomicrobia bacterium]|nr:sigma-54-dependent Fis family transcriptional regulator [Verrucomicrobiota bacterium]